MRLLRRAVVGNAKLCARLHSEGLVHGMLRTDNVALIGAAIDVGGLKRQQELAQTGNAKNAVNMPAMYTLKRQPEAVLQCLVICTFCEFCFRAASSWRWCSPRANLKRNCLPDRVNGISVWIGMRVLDQLSCVEGCKAVSQDSV